MFIKNELEDFILSINSKKICDSNQNTDPFVLQMLAEAQSMLGNLKTKDEKHENKIDISDINQIMFSKEHEMPREEENKSSLNAASLLAAIENQEKYYQQISSTSTDLRSIIDEVTNPNTAVVRARPQELQNIIDQKNILNKLSTETDPVKKLEIHESGIALGIVVGQTNHSEAINILKQYSKFSPDESEPFCFYSDISLSVFFDDNNLVSELKFGNRYKGKTSKGLAIGDSVATAIEIYGQPKLKSARGAMWNKFAIFSENNIVEAIRIQK